MAQIIISIDDLYWSSDLSEPCPSGSLCCDDTQILSISQHRQQLTPINSEPSYSLSSQCAYLWYNVLMSSTLRQWEMKGIATGID